MKKFSIFLLIMIAFVGFTSCEHDDDVVFTAQPDPEGIVFMSSTAESYTLTSETANNIAERFVWSEVDFDAPTTVTYELQGSSDADFSSFNIIGTTGENNIGFVDTSDSVYVNLDTIQDWEKAENVLKNMQ